MVQRLNQLPLVIQNSQGQRCSSRPRRPRWNSFPPYLNWDFTTQQYNYTDNNNNYQGSLSNRMEVTLLPGAFNQPGSAPGANELEPITSFLRRNYPNDQFIKGHMWNQEIGGPGVTQNLVPLTSQANSAHKNNVETALKNALRDFSTFYERNNSSHVHYDQIYGFRYVVEIENDYWPTVTEQIVPNSIHVQIFPIKCDPQINISDENSIINNAVSQVSRNTINRLVNGIWIDQNGVVTDA